MSLQDVLIGGTWRTSAASVSFQAENPATRQPLPDEYPVSPWSDCNAALDAAADAYQQLRCASAEQIAQFLEIFADRIEQQTDAIVAMAHAETALPVSPRLADVELPRTTNQLRQAADAARDGSWSMPTIDTAGDIRSCFAAIGPVIVFGPNNFPLAFNSVAGGDFAAAIAAGNPVIAKANSSHPGTTRLLSAEAQMAVEAAGLPPATVQLIYRTGHEDGERLVADPRIGATGYTGSRAAGLRLKAAADAAGKPIYLELSSCNPVIMLPGALEERSEEIAADFAGSCLLGTGQFCTNPGLVILLAGPSTDAFIDELRGRFENAPVGTLLSRKVASSLAASLDGMQQAGAELLVGNTPGGGTGYSHANTLLRASGDVFLRKHAELQMEAFGNASLLVVARDINQAAAIIEHLEGNLTGAIYTHTQGNDDPIYDRLEPLLRVRVGRLLNDKMPTGVAVSPAMNHGGPYPATGHPGFTAVGIPVALRRFAMLNCYDNVRAHRLPPLLQDKNPTGKTWRLIDGNWTTGDVLLTAPL